MKKTNTKKMVDFLDKILPESSLWIVIFGCLVTAFGAFIQYRKDIVAANKEIIAAKEALETEMRRVAEHDSLQMRSNAILDSTSDVLSDTEQLLSDNIKLLANADTLLKRADTTILGQAELINKQVTTIQHIAGTDKIPILFVEVTSYYGSYTEYEVTFSTFVPDEFPLRDYILNIAKVTDNELITIQKSALTENDQKSAISILDERYDRIGPKIIPGNTVGLLKTYKVPFQNENDLTYYNFVVSWNKGSYKGVVSVKIDDFLPFLKLEKSNLHPRTPAGDGGKYITLQNKIDRNVQKLIKENKMKDQFRNTPSSKEDKP